MAKQKHFNGTTELVKVHHIGRKAFGSPADFVPFYVPGVGWNHGAVPVERTINMKSFPSKHECDARCMNATGKTMNCECACGGVNHGRGAFQCEAA